MRPVSPFLSIYKPQIGSIFSILGRISGLILAIVFLLVAILSFLKEMCLSNYTFFYIYYLIFKVSFSNVLFSSFLFFSILTFFYHFLFSVRFIIWYQSKNIQDFDISLNLSGLYKISLYMTVIALILSLLFWLYI